jgi:Fic family protein
MSKIPQLYKEWLSLQPLNEKKERDIRQQFLVDFNYNSNHLEGNTLTYGQTRLLLLFGDTIGSAKMQDYEEMKAHNVGLEWMKSIAADKDKTLTEVFIRELNRIILVRNFFKTSRDGDYRYEIKVGTYKTRPNSVITPSGEIFDYASPEETPQLMGDLVRWYRNEERKGKLKVEELAAIFHYRYIRIHPFEDGNGRIARLLVNYICLRHNYPMIVIRTDDRENYLKVLHECDDLCGKIPYDGANASLEQTKPLIDYISIILENKLETLIKFVKGEVPNFIEAKDVSVTVENDPVNDSVNDPVNGFRDEVLSLMKENPHINYDTLAEKTNRSRATIRRMIKQLKTENRIERVGSDKTGHWKII